MPFDSPEFLDPLRFMCHFQLVDFSHRLVDLMDIYCRWDYVSRILSTGWCTPPGQTPPRQTRPGRQPTSPGGQPPWADTPRQTHPPPWADTPPRRLLQRTVRILWECILVQNENENSFLWFPFRIRKYGRLSLCECCLIVVLRYQLSNLFCSSLHNMIHRFFKLPDHNKWLIMKKEY